jgi:pimeloyl-ACP methyl ester carboxylesterase
MSSWILRTVGVLLMLTALAVSLSRAPDRSVQSLVANWAKPPSDFIDVKGQTVHLRDEGPKSDPQPIVLIHGTGASLHTWEGWVRALKGQRRVITLDLPGFGLTGPYSASFTGSYPHDTYQGDAFARFVLDTLDVMKVGRFVMGGNSLGGEVAWRTAYLAPDRVVALILVDATGPAFTPLLVPLGFKVARVPVIGRISEWLLPRSMVAQSLAEVYGDPKKITPELVDRYFELTLREGNRRAMGLRLQHLVAGENAERIATLKLPTLILWGGKDQLVPPDTAKIFQQQIVGSQLQVFEALGHVPHEEDPAQTVLPVMKFLGLQAEAKT